MQENQEQQGLKAVSDLLSKGDLRGAFGAAQELLRQFPSNPRAWHINCDILLRARQNTQALSLARQALEHFPESLPLSINLCECLLAANAMAEARTQADALAAKPLQDPFVVSSLAMVYASLNEHEISLSFYQKALDLKPDEETFYYNMATSQRFLGLIDEAEQSLDKALRFNSGDGEAQLMRSNLRQQTSERNHVEQLQSLVNTPSLSPNIAIPSAYALAKELEDLERFDESFTALKLGSDTQRKHMRYEVQADLDIMAKIEEVFSEEMFSGSIEGCDSDEPIFIIGMPRSGTTLVERILGSHDEVYAAGELNNFSLELMRLARPSGPATASSRLNLIENTAHIDFGELGKNYIASTRPLTGHSARFIDKLPFNYLYAGLIHLAFPKAKIISLVREPLDSCFAVYKQLFREAYPFSYQLDDLADYYIAYRRLMKHWNQVIPGGVYEVSYEALVNDLEGESRALLAHCDLPWQSQCLDFHLNSAASTTASATQVREKLYTSSIGRWRHFEMHLQGLKSRLEAAGIETA